MRHAFLAVLLATTTLASAQDTRGLVKVSQQPVSMISTGSNRWLADFGRDAFGQIEITVNSQSAEDSVVLYLGECIMGDSRVDRTPGGSRRCLRLPFAVKPGLHTYRPTILNDKRNTKPGAVLMPEAIGQVLPFRYVEIEGCHRQPQAVTRLAVNVAFNDSAAYFHCDDDALNRVWELCKYSIKATSFTGYYVDGDRERIPYEADALLNQLSHYATDNQYDMSRRTFEWLVENPTWPTEWMLQLVMIAWNDCLYTGDTSLLRRYLDNLRAHTLLALRDDSTGLITTRRGQSQDFLKSIHRKDKISDIVDWPHSDMGKGEDDNYVYTDFNTVVNAYHYEAMRCMAEIYNALGMKRECRETEKYLKKFYDTFNKSFFNKEKGVYRDGVGTDHASLHANMFALAFGLVPEEHRKSVTDFVISRGMACSVYGAQFLLDALYNGRNADAALRLMTANGKRGWLNMLREGSTITMEAWGNEYKPNQDWNHAWGAAPANIIPLRLMGVRPTEPGYRKAEIRPQIAWLRHAECKVPTLYGSIEVSINRTENSYDVLVNIPKDITADVYLPLPKTSSYKTTVDGKQVKTSSTVDGFINLPKALSGKHQIKVEM